MYRKKYGKMTVSAWLNAEMEQTSLPMTIIGGILLAAACIAVRMVSGSPYRMMLELGISDLVPPVWLMSALRFLSFVTIGCAAGLVLGYRERGCYAEKYRGCMLFVLLAVLELCWYPTLFKAGLVFLCLLESIVILVLSVCVTISFLRVSKFSGFILILHNIWLCYLLILAFAVFFRN